MEQTTSISAQVQVEEGEIAIQTADESIRFGAFVPDDEPIAARPRLALLTPSQARAIAAHLVAAAEVAELEVPERLWT